MERKRPTAFTLIEILLAVGILSGLMVAVYASWSAIVRGSRTALESAVESNRLRVAMTSIEDALNSAVMYELNLPYYAFLADTTEDFAALSVVARLPPSFPGSGLFPEQRVRRVSFSVERANSMNQLVMRQNPILAPLDGGEEPYPLVLARNVGLFSLEFWDPQLQDWAPEWLLTNTLPSAVKVSLGVKANKKTKLQDNQIVSRVVAIPAVTVRARWQRPSVVNAAQQEAASAADALSAESPRVPVLRR